MEAHEGFSYSEREAYMGYDPCKGCGGEDCICCEVWLERQADVRSAQYDTPGDYRDEYDDYGDYRDEYEDDEDDGQPTEYEEWQDFNGGDDWDHGQYDGDYYE